MNDEGMKPRSSGRGDVTAAELLQKIETFLAERQMSPTRFGVEALNDREFVRRLRRGSDVRLLTVQKVNEFIDSERKKSRV